MKGQSVTEALDEWKTHLKEQKRREQNAIDAFVSALPLNDGGAAAMLAFDALFELGAVPWGVLFRRVQGVDASPAFREQFLQSWIVCGDAIRDASQDDLNLIKGLRYLLPVYSGSGMTLYRGDCFESRRIRRYGMSWTSNMEVARGFAQGKARLCVGGGVLLATVALPEAIICAPALMNNGYEEDEYIVDRRFLRDVRVIERYPEVPFDAHRSARVSARAAVSVNQAPGTGAAKRRSTGGI